MGESYVLVLLTVAICVFGRQVGDLLGVIDIPDSGRKAHARPTPLVGGIAIMAPVLAWTALRLLLQPAVDELALAILLCSGGVAIVGFMDDQRANSATSRLILLVIFSLAALKIDPGLYVSRLHSAHLGSFPLSPAVSVPLVVLALAGFASSVNMVDGMNGLVLSLLCVWSLCVALVGGGTREIAELLAAASFIALLFNIRGRLFLGDCGAFAISFTLGLLAIEAHNEGRLSLETAAVWFFLPVIDCLRLIPTRILSGHSPFRPDRFHLHHRLAERFGERPATIGYVALVAATSVVSAYRPDLSMPCIYLDFGLYLGFMLTDAWLSPAVRQRDENNRPNVVALNDKNRPGR